MSHRGILLQTPENFTPLQQHVHGVTWLRESLERHDTSWLCFEREIPPGPKHLYDIVVTPEGDIDWEPRPRRLRQPEIDSPPDKD